MKCPRCEREMVKRQNKRTGQWFYGCQNFPNCTRTESIETRSTNSGHRSNYNYAYEDDAVYDAGSTYGFGSDWLT